LFIGASIIRRTRYTTMRPLGNPVEVAASALLTPVNASVREVS
jgi:hypothetical protein